jgi:dTDP-glucose pyrophosphorylase
MIKKDDIKKAILTMDSSISDAILSLEKSGLQVVIITDNNSILLGLITDGDIRRGFINGHTLESSVTKIMENSPLTVDTSVQRNEANKIMIEHKIQHIPVVDKRNRIVDIYKLDDFDKGHQHENTIVIMAGGFGKRLMPHTKDCPKPMLLIKGKPMLEHIIVRAISQGFNNFIISLFYLPNVIKDYFKNGEAWGANISYIQEDSPLGTAGALSLISAKNNLPILVTNGDLLSNINYVDLLDHHSKLNSKATMVVKEYEIQNPFGVVNVNEHIINGFEEKPIYCSLINAGIYVLDPDMLNFLEEDVHCDMPSLFERVIANSHKASVFKMHESWMDIGRPDDLNLASKSINDK